ncbi:MAG TPA: cation diffusion facilitator family transporter [Candidatus Dormibacteraeota bacterium]|nr:cation diffusion facilitator family transporter [Candidatus Dormibacteraeota bacterium]
MSGGHSHGTGAYDDRDAVRAVVVSAAALGIASALEFIAAIGGHSAGVLADALHNAGDVLTTGILLASFWLGRRPATRRFPAGFGRIEDVATLLIVVVIVITAGAAAWASILKLMNPMAVGTVPFGLFAAGVGVVANLAVSEYKVRVGRSIRSAALAADGIHSRIDALVSVGAAAGIGLAAAGFGWADPVAGLAITGMILYILAGTVRDLFYRMMDAVDPEVMAEIAEHAGSVKGVLGVHDIQARWVGRQMAVVLHVDCDPGLTLREAHDLAMKVEHEVGHAVPAGRLDVHMDPGTGHHQHDAASAHGHEMHDRGTE